MKKPRPKKRDKEDPSTPNPAAAGDPPEPPTLDVRIDAVAFGGDGLARHEGKVIFVPDTVPEEEVRIELTEDKGRFARGRVVKRLRFAPYLQQSPCPYARRCGGCQWLEVPYAHQLAWKHSFIAAAMKRIARWELPVDFQVLPSPELQGYRNRIKLKLKRYKDGRIEFGFYAKQSWSLVPIERCWIAAAPINEALQRLARLRLPPTSREGLFELELQHLPADGDQLTAVLLPPLAHELRRTMIEVSARDPWLHQHLSWPDEAIVSRPFERDGPIEYRTTPGQFQQINLAANRRLRSWVQEKVRALKARRILDLFCGSGNFSLQLAYEGCEVWGLEIAEAAIRCAQDNRLQNGIRQAHYAQGSAEQIGERFPELLPETIDCIIVDPPRKGLGDALQPLLRLGAPAVIYISCDPNTLARDLLGFFAAAYRVTDGVGFDFFPHSYHVETALVLQRTTSSADA